MITPHRLTLTMLCISFIPCGPAHAGGYRVQPHKTTSHANTAVVPVHNGASRILRSDEFPAYGKYKKVLLAKLFEEQCSEFQSAHALVSLLHTDARRTLFPSSKETSASTGSLILSREQSRLINNAAYAHLCLLHADLLGNDFNPQALTTNGGPYLFAQCKVLGCLNKTVGFLNGVINSEDAVHTYIPEEETTEPCCAAFDEPSGSARLAYDLALATICAKKQHPDACGYSSGLPSRLRDHIDRQSSCPNYPHWLSNNFLYSRNQIRTNATRNFSTAHEYCMNVLHALQGTNDDLLVIAYNQRLKALLLAKKWIKEICYY